MGTVTHKFNMSDKVAINKTLGDIRNKIANIAVASQGQAVENALFSAAKPIADQAKREVAVGPRRRLRRGIARKRLAIVRGGQIARVGVTVVNPSGSKFVKQRWHWEEFGFKGRKKPVRPYFQPAFDKKRGEALRIFEKHYAANVRKALRSRLKLNKNWAPKG